MQYSRGGKRGPAIHALFTWGKTGANGRQREATGGHVGKLYMPYSFGWPLVGQIPGAAKQAPALEDYRTLTAEVFRDRCAFDLTGGTAREFCTC